MSQEVAEKAPRKRTLNVMKILRPAEAAALSQALAQTGTSTKQLILKLCI